MTPQFLQDFWNWLAQALQSILDMLNPVNLVLSNLAWIIEMLPLKNGDIDYFLDQFLFFWTMLDKYVRIADYFVPVPALAIFWGIVLGVNAALAILQLWRMIKSVVI